MMARVYGVPKQAGVGGGVVSTVRIVGIPALLAKLRLVGTIASAEMGLLTRGAAMHAYGLALAKVPTITGNLRSGIAVEKLPASYAWGVSASSVAGSDPGGLGKNQKEYAGFVEFGTSKMAPRHFMTDAFRETSPIVYSDLKLIAAKLMRL
jgi:HK97 gp10 family phage protein